MAISFFRKKQGSCRAVDCMVQTCGKQIVKLYYTPSNRWGSVHTHKKNKFFEMLNGRSDWPKRSYRWFIPTILVSPAHRWNGNSDSPHLFSSHKTRIFEHDQPVSQNESCRNYYSPCTICIWSVRYVTESSLYVFHSYSTSLSYERNNGHPLY